MFDVGWSEMLVIAVVMIVVVGPKDLPRMLRTFGKTTAKLRSMAGDFRRQFDDALREAELDDLKSTIDTVRGLDPRNIVRRELDPIAKAAQDVRSGLDSMMRPTARVDDKASPAARAEEPAKVGAAPLPGMADPAAPATAAPVTAPLPGMAATPAIAPEPVFQLGPSPLPAPPVKKEPATKAKAPAKPKAARAKKDKSA